ncbi:MAG: hypothetical protein FWF15_06035 [Oscillospiraceae bacterium]|nr:hypothetical protein [Oscillospiraceae bacterium]
MVSFKEKMWIWGHDAGQHNGICNITGLSKMSPLEGAMYLGVPNMCRVIHGNMPEPPFERDALALDVLDNVVWSIIGDGGSARNYGGHSDIDDVVEVAKNHPNIIGGIMDDIYHPPRLAGYTPDMLTEYKRKMCDGVGRDMQLWTVVYVHELDREDVIPFLAECDVASLWTWTLAELPALEENFAKFREIWGYDRPLYGGCYLWAYPDGRPMDLDLLKKQLDTYYKWIIEHKLDGVIFCSNTICDIGLESAKIVKDWIAEHKDEII